MSAATVLFSRRSTSPRRSNGDRQRRNEADCTGPGIRAESRHLRMSTKPAPESNLREFYAAESARIRTDFSANSDGRAAVHGRTALVDSVALRLWKELISPEGTGPQNFALVALGGYGRRWLFPYSDIDILFLHAGGGAERD